MAFRLGYQISCNLNNNVLIRSASVGSSRRFRALSPSCLFGQLKDNVIPNASLAATLSHRRYRSRVPSESFRISSMIKTLQNYPAYRNFSQIRPDDEQEAADVVLAQNNSTSKPFFNIVKIRKGPVTHKLQPKNINPVATVNINLNSLVPFEEKTPHSEKFQILRKQAQSQYLKAVRNLNKKDEEFSYRYKLEAANPKPSSENAYSAVDVRQKLQQAVHTTVPQLQPKNIKPFGNITNVQWRAPNVEKVKQGYVVYQNRNETSDTNENFAVKKGDSDRDVSKNLSSIQQREYCTAQGANDSEKCNNIQAEYKRINSDYTQNESFPTPANPESKQPIENNTLQMADESPQTGEYKTQNNRYMLYMSGGSVYSKRIPEEPNSTIYKNNFKPLNETTIFHRSKTSTRPITVKIGPKWKLQSTGGPDIIESVGSLNPGANERFVVPWPSYAERIKTSKTPRQPKPLTSITDVDEANNVLKDKYDAMYNKIQSDTNTLYLKPQNVLPDVGSSNKQSISVLSREYSTGLRRSEVGKEQRGFFNMRKSSDYYDVLSKISDIQEKRYASYKGLSMKPLQKHKMKSKLKQLSKSEVPQKRMNVPISDPVTKPPIIHHVGKAVKANLSRETLFTHIRNKLKSQVRNQSDLQRSDTLTKPYGGYMFSRQRAFNSVSDKAPVMMFSTLTRIQPDSQDMSFSRDVFVRKTCCSSRVDESLRILRSYMQPLNAPDHPQVCDEGLLSQLKSNVNNPLSKQNLNSMCLFNRSLSNLEEPKTNHVNIFDSIWTKVTEYFSFLNAFKVPQVCFECDSERPARDVQGGFLNSNFLSSGKNCSANCSQTTGLYSVTSRNYSNWDKFEARRKRRKEPCPCIRRKLNMTQPGMKRLPKHPPMDRPPYKCELPCVDLKTFRADVIAHLESKRKSLPKLEVGDCPCPEIPKSDIPQPKLKRLPKIKYDRLLHCVSQTVCVEQIRADKDLKDEKKTLPVLVPGRLPDLEKQPPKEVPASLKRLPKAPFIDRPPYKCELPCVDLGQFRTDANLAVKPKILPKLEVGDCPCPVHQKTDTPQPILKRLPKPPPEDHVWECRDTDECAESEKYRADRGLDFSKKKCLPILVPGTCPPEDIDVCPPHSKGKTTPSIFKNNNRKFSTMANRFETDHERRCFSTNSQKRNEPKECKKLGRSTKKQCKKLTLVKCEPAKSISCKKKIVMKTPCKKTSSPYPAFSECKDEDNVPPLTECETSQKHLQPRWPIINDILTLKPPPPKQGKIDPSKEEQCVMRKLNLMRSGTKTCENFYASEKSFNAKEMLAKHREEEDEDGDGDECEGSSEFTNFQEEEIPPKEDVCEKRTKSKSADLCGVNSKPDSATEQTPSDKQEKKAVCSLPKHEKPCQAPVKTTKGHKQDPPKLTAKDICDLTKKKMTSKPKKKSSMFGFFGQGKSKAKKASPVSKKKVPVTVACPPKGFFQRIFEFFFGKPSRPKPLLSEKSKKKVSSTSKLRRKGTTTKKKPVFCYTKASAAKKKPKGKDISKTSKSNAKPSNECKEHKPKKESEECKPLEESEESEPLEKSEDCKEDCKPSKESAPKITKALVCPDEIDTKKTKETAKKHEKASTSQIKEPSHKMLEVTKAALCADERKKEKSKEQKNKAEKVTCGKETKKSTHKITELTKASSCSDERKELKKEESSEIKKPKHKIAGITQVSLCPDELEGGEILDEGGEILEEGSEDCKVGEKSKQRTSSGRCRIPSYRDCPPKARESCKTYLKRRPPCKAKETPYSSFSECHKNFPKIPISECTEQERRFNQQEMERESLNKENKKIDNSE